MSAGWYAERHFDSAPIRFFGDERLLRYQSLRTSLAKLARRAFDNPIDRSLNYLLVQEREVGLPWRH